MNGACCNLSCATVHAWLIFLVNPFHIDWFWSVISWMWSCGWQGPCTVSLVSFWSWANFRFGTGFGICLTRDQTIRDSVMALFGSWNIDTTPRPLERPLHCMCALFLCGRLIFNRGSANHLDFRNHDDDDGNTARTGVLLLVLARVTLFVCVGKRQHQHQHRWLREVRACQSTEISKRTDLLTLTWSN